MINTFNNILKDATEPELCHLLDYLEADKTAEIISKEILNTNNSFGDAEISRIVQAVFESKKDQEDLEGSQGYDIFEWLQYWFGADLSKEKLNISGVFFKKSEEYLEGLANLAGEYQTNRVDIPAENIDEVKQDIVAFNEAVDTIDRPTIQAFIDKYAETYKVSQDPAAAINAEVNSLKNELSVEDNIHTTKKINSLKMLADKVTQKNLTENDQDIIDSLVSKWEGMLGDNETLPTIDTYGTKSKGKSARNKKIIKNYNEKINVDQPKLFDEIRKNITLSIESLKDEINAKVPYDPRYLGWTSRSYFTDKDTGEDVENEKELKDIPEKLIHIGLKHIIKSKERSIELYEQQLDNEEKHVNEYSQELIKLKKRYLRLRSKAQTAEKKYEVLQNVIKENEDLIKEAQNTYNNTQQQINILNNLQMPAQDQNERLEEFTANLNESTKYIHEITAERDKYVQELNMKMYDVVFRENYDKAQETLDIIRTHEDYIKESSDDAKALGSYKRNIPQYKKLLEWAEEELVYYEGILSIIDKEKIDVMDKEGLRELLFSLNEVLRDRDKIPLLAEEEEDRSMLVYEEGVPEDKLVGKDSILKLRDVFVRGLTEYPEKQKKKHKVDNEFNSLVQKQLSTVVGRYEDLKKEVINGISRFHQEVVASKKGKVFFDIEKDADVVDEVSAGYKDRVNMISDIKNYINDNISKGTTQTSDGLKDRYKNLPRDFEAAVLAAPQVLSLLTKLNTLINTNSEAKNTLNALNIDASLVSSAINDVSNLKPSDSAKEIRKRMQEISIEDRKNLYSKEHNITGLTRNFSVPFREYAKHINKLNTERLEQMANSGIVLSNAVDNIFSKDFPDIDKLKSMFLDASHVPGLSELVKDQNILKYRRDVNHAINDKDRALKDVIKKEVINSVIKFKSVVHAAIKDMMKSGTKFNEELYGEFGKIHGMRSNFRAEEEKLQGITSRIEEDTKNYEEAAEAKEPFEGLTEENMDSYKKDLADSINTARATKKDIESTIEKLGAELQNAQSSLQEPLEYELLKNKALHPQMGEIVKRIGDPRDSQQGDTLDSTTAEDIFQGILSTKPTAKRPEDVPEVYRSWHSWMYLFDKLILQCKKSLSNSYKSDEKKYAPRNNEYSPAYKENTDGPLRAELKQLKNEYSKTQDAGLKEDANKIIMILQKTQAKPKELIKNEISNLMRQEQDKNTRTRIEYLRDLANKTKFAPNDLVKKDIDTLDSLRYTDEDRGIISGAMSKGGGQKSREVSALIGYENMLAGVIATLDSKYKKEKDSLAPDIIKDMKSQKDALFTKLFKVKYSPNTLTPEDIDEIDKLSELYEKEQGAKFTEQLERGMLFEKEEHLRDVRRQKIEKIKGIVDQVKKSAVTFLSSLADALPPEKHHWVSLMLENIETVDNSEKRIQDYNDNRKRINEIENKVKVYGKDLTDDEKLELERLSNEVDQYMAESDDKEDLEASATALLNETLEQIKDYPADTISDMTLKKQYDDVTSVIESYFKASMGKYYKG